MWGEEPVVNPRRGKLPRVVPTPTTTAGAVALGLATLLVLAVTAAVMVAFGDAAGGFIYANF